MANEDMDRVVPLGQLDDFKVAEGDPDVRGWEVLASDGRKIGEVDELLVDTSAMKVRYLDVDVDGGVMGDGQDRHVLIPIGYARLELERDCVLVDGLASSDLVGLPAYDQGPLTRDFEASVRDSFGRRPTPSEGLMAGAGMMDTAGLDNTPGTGTGMTGVAGGALSDPGTRADDTRRLGDAVPDGEGMRAAGYDADRGTAPPRTGPSWSGTDVDAGVREGDGTSAGLTPGGTVGGGGGDRLSAGGHTLGSGADRLAAGGQGPVGGMDAGREPQGDASRRAGQAGSDSPHNTDEDFYASDAFDEGRFYGARRGGGVGDAGASGEPGQGTGDVGASREETHRLAQDARELRREDHQNRDVDGRGGL